MYRRGRIMSEAARKAAITGDHWILGSHELCEIRAILRHTISTLEYLTPELCFLPTGLVEKAEKEKMF